MVPQLSADDVVRILGLQPHPEGGCFRETFRDAAGAGGRSHSTAIYYLLRAGEASHWHRVDAAEVWHWYGGCPLHLGIAEAGGAQATQVLGPDLAQGHRPQIVVPANAWQRARSAGAWTLAGCTVAPGFEFAHFQIAAPDFSPAGWSQ